MLYWAYLVVFIANVMVPIFVHEGYISIFTLPAQVVEMICLFVVGIFGFSLYAFKYYSHEHFTRECAICRRDIVKISKDLSFSYNYIGEINRKIDILKGLVLMPTGSESEYFRSKKEAYKSILRAIEGLAECRSFFAGLYDKKTFEPIKIVRRGEKDPLESEVSRMLKDAKTNAFSFGEHYVVKTDCNSSGICAFVVLKKNSLKNETIDLVKTILRKMLFLHMYTGSEERMKNSEEKSLFEKII